MSNGELTPTSFLYVLYQNVLTSWKQSTMTSTDL